MEKNVGQAEPRVITGFSAGDPLRIQRRAVNPCPGVPITDILLTIKKDNQDIITKKTKTDHFVNPIPIRVPTLISKNDEVCAFHFDLTPEETEQLRQGAHHYQIDLGSGETRSTIESGLMTVNSPRLLPPSPPPSTAIPGDPTYSSPTAYTSYADACQTVTGRTALIIDGFLDSILGAYRQLKVWDEHARRRADNPAVLQLTYEYINQYPAFEIYDGNNTPVDNSDVTFDYRNGNFTVNSDDGNQDYFVTYSFNFFPETVLRMMVQMSLLELNFVGVGAGAGYLTHYTAVDSTPKEWDGLIALGAAAKAWKRLATDIAIWRNWLIFDGDMGEGIVAPTGATAQQAADSASQYYQQMFMDFGAATKFDKFLAFPTTYYQIFATTGYGSFGPYVTNNTVTGGKFRGTVINKGWSI